MKKLARFAALLLTAVMALTLLAGCSGNFQSNPQAEEAILAYVNETYTTLDDADLTNDDAMRLKAAEVLSKVNEDGTITKNDARYYKMIEFSSGTVQIKGQAACTENEALDNGLLKMASYAPGQTSQLLGNFIGLGDETDHSCITSFGVATRVIGDKTYVAIAYEASIE